LKLKHDELRRYAEADGWAFDARLGAWTPPAQLRAGIRSFEKFAKTLTDEAVDAMDLGQLKGALEELVGGRVLPVVARQDSVIQRILYPRFVRVRVATHDVASNIWYAHCCMPRHPTHLEPTFRELSWHPMTWSTRIIAGTPWLETAAAGAREGEGTRRKWGAAEAGEGGGGADSGKVPRPAQVPRHWAGSDTVTGHDVALFTST